MLELPDGQALFTSSVLWGLWKTLDGVYAKLCGYYRDDSPTPEAPDAVALQRAMLELKDDRSPVMTGLARAWKLAGGRDLSAEELSGVLAPLTREEGLVVLAVLFYAKTA